MYQTIDDPDLETEAPRTGIWPFLLGGLLLIGIFVIVFLNSPGKAINPIQNDENVAATEAYRKAISEPSPALRRARLNDYLLTIENGPHEDAVLTQIDVINRYEMADWQDVQNQVYNSRIKKDDKLAALDTYEANWGGALLGGREDDIARLRIEINGLDDATDLPDRRLEGGPSPIPTNVPDTELAGGPRPTTIFIPPVTQPTTSAIKEVEANVTPLRVRKSVRPRYPRKAQRRNVEAIVTLKLNIDARGRVAMTELVSIEAERYEKDFVKAAERAAMRSRYYPKTVNGEPVAVSGITKRYRFEAN